MRNTANQYTANEKNGWTTGQRSLPYYLRAAADISSASEFDNVHVDFPRDTATTPATATGGGFDGSATEAFRGGICSFYHHQEPYSIFMDVRAQFLLLKFFFDLSRPLFEMR